MEMFTRKVAFILSVKIADNKLYRMEEIAAYLAKNKPFWV